MKHKTNKSLAKRFKVTKSGLLMHSVGQWNHLRGKKKSQVRYNKRQERVLSEAFAKKIKKLI